MEWFKENKKVAIIAAVVVVVLIVAFGSGGEFVGADR